MPYGSKSYCNGALHRKNTINPISAQSSSLFHPIISFVFLLLIVIPCYKHLKRFYVDWPSTFENERPWQCDQIHFNEIC